VGSYPVRVREQGTQDRLPLRFSRTGSVFSTVRSVLKQLSECQRHPSEPHLIRVTKVHHDDADIWGIVERGEYGFTATGIHSETFVPSYKRAAKHAELIPLYYRFHLPASGTTGILRPQRLGVHRAFSAI
jgi:hypothetical protein